MLNKNQLDSARVYNKQRFMAAGLFETLPWPWSDLHPNDEAFAWATALYQHHEPNIAVSDGKLGPKTQKVLGYSKAVAAPFAAKTSKHSNRIIIDGKRVGVPEGITATNYLDDDEPRFSFRARTHDVVNLVIHETCGTSAKGCKNTLLRKGYGVQLIFDKNGHVSNHGDLIRDRMVHANQLNNVSYGMEFVNPYIPRLAKSPWTQTIPRQWWTWVPKGGKKLYVMPTPAQLDAAKIMIPWLCEMTGVPYAFPTAYLNKKQRRIDNWDRKGNRAHPDAGAVAHCDFAKHSDGRFILEMLIAEAKK